MPQALIGEVGASPSRDRFARRRGREAAALVVSATPSPSQSLLLGIVPIARPISLAPFRNSSRSASASPNATSCGGSVA